MGLSPSGRYDERRKSKPASTRSACKRPAGREAWHTQKSELVRGPQWVGRGIKIALSQESKGCSRIYSAGLDDTDCGLLDCEKLPAGQAKIVFADGTPLADTRFASYQHSRKRSKDQEFSLTADRNGMITTPAQRGCFDIAIEHTRFMHLCFSGQAASGPITVVLPPKPKP